ncbi:copper chaperone PCu(A)C [Pseudomonas aeruginosa]|uniref:copper chaperone PCu(A)C n=1 Tax=Pseudomonas aeruginosa TaxID=287 RepID=UPI00249E8AF7|nr:copper chaperone PCu(A)C [Pseudomonas aeruginosa]MDI3903604.1 copper chaperone PCu(A)C [Pseudomonas aeruginosa]MDI4007004.1 copper chaperone PCu(A)C [Pseudomonas aeruginosa]
MRTSFFAAAALLAVSAFAQAHEYNAGQLHIEHPWALALPPTSPNGAAYFVVQNHGKENDTLLGVDTPRAASAEVHEHVHKNGMMSMQKVDSVDVAPGKDLRFAPGGYHLMLMGLKQPLVAGERFPLTLHFRKAGDVPVEIVVESKAPAEQGGHEQHGH